MSEVHDIFVRAHTVVPEKKPPSALRARNGRTSCLLLIQRPPSTPPRSLTSALTGDTS